jgi:hypothetical protein
VAPPPLGCAGASLGCGQVSSHQTGAVKQEINQPAAYWSSTSGHYRQLGLVLPLESAAGQSNQTKNPSKDKDEVGMRWG